MKLSLMSNFSFIIILFILLLFYSDRYSSISRIDMKNSMSYTHTLARAALRTSREQIENEVCRMFFQRDFHTLGTPLNIHRILSRKTAAV